MKIAVVTDDGTTVSLHFGQARYYAVLTVDGKRVVGREMVDRGDTLRHVAEHESHSRLSEASDCHGTGTAAAATHLRMVQPILGCDAVLAGGMGWGARESLLEAGIRPILTEITGLDEAVQAYLEGTIVDHVERLH